MRAGWAIALFGFLTAGFVPLSQGQTTGVIIGFRAAPAESLVTQTHGQVVRRLNGINAIAADVPVSSIAALRKDPRVKFVEPDYEVTTMEVGAPIPTGDFSAAIFVQPAQTTPSGIIQIGADKVSLKTTLAQQQVPVAVIDTGILYTHPDLAGNVVVGPSFVLGNPSSTDDHGHGTHVAGTIAAVNNSIGVIGVAPKAQVTGVKVLDSSGSGTNSAVIQGIDWAAANGMKVINLSLGSSAHSAALKISCDNANSAGVLVVAAAGNTGTKVNHFPGAYATVFCVSAIDGKNGLAVFSTFGSQIDICAPGVSVKSTYLFDEYVLFNGTSMATPHVAGTAALVRGAYPKFKNNDIRARLQNTATNLGPSGWDNKFGYGKVNAQKAVSP